MKEANPEESTGLNALAERLIVPLAGLSAHMLPLAGGKAANLGELIHAGLPVPEGFCITTAAYRLISEAAGLAPIVREITRLRPTEIVRLEECAAAARDAISRVVMPEAITQAVRQAYARIGSDEGRAAGVPVAVRSSATAEDLPFASFAGQQDTYLNIVGVDALLDAVRQCWASLWTYRAVSYRAASNIDRSRVHLAVVVQRMVDAEVAGVLFTANPLSGKRRQAVMDASPGLGEAVVSGAVNPDHFVVNTYSGEIIERRLGDKLVEVRPRPGGGTEHVELASGIDSSSLTDAQVVALARLGAQVEAHFGTPQDIEWAIDRDGCIWLTQSRPITTLYPLPATAPTGEDNLRAYFSVNVAQGVFRPFTPMGIAAFRLMVSSGAIAVGFPPKSPAAGPAFLVEAGQRLFMDVTTLLRSVIGPEILHKAMSRMEARSGVVLAHLAHDPRFKPIVTPRRTAMRRFLGVIPRLRQVPFYTIQALISPRAARQRLHKLQLRLRTLGNLPDSATPEERLDAFERLLVGNTAPIVLGALPLIAIIFGFMAWLGRLLDGLATEDEWQSVLRSLPHNPTTEMDLALWKIAERVRVDREVSALLLNTSPEQLAVMYHGDTLPATLQRELADFLRVYGHRGVAEIDLGLPRWSEDPTHVLGVLANYLRLEDPKLAPDVQFSRGARKARAAAAELRQRARKRSPIRGLLVSFCLSRLRGLAGLREVPKYNLVLLISKGRQMLVPVGEELALRGRLDDAHDIFFIDTKEAREGLAGKDLRALIRQRHANYEQELGRRHIPRVILSDGTEPERDLLTEMPAGSDSGSVLKGTPASSGQVTAKARVVLDPTGAYLEPGEILVAPSTDPGWTPLFLTAGGLVMEMGGAMSHGAVVAREYGIPAVVGVTGATEQIVTGQAITVDGSSGTVTAGT